jgi:hypothetical protein
MRPERATYSFLLALKSNSRFANLMMVDFELVWRIYALSEESFVVWVALISRILKNILL